jgi:hypothetical protein
MRRRALLTLLGCAAMIDLVLAADMSKPKTKSMSPAEDLCRAGCELSRLDGRLPQLHEGRMLKYRHRMSAR